MKTEYHECSDCEVEKTCVSVGGSYICLGCVAKAFLEDSPDEPPNKRNCRLCEHFRKPFGQVDCDLLSRVRDFRGADSRPDVNQWTRYNWTDAGMKSDAEDCPGYMLSSEILVKLHRKEHGACRYCDWPCASDCHHDEHTGLKTKKYRSYSLMTRHDDRPKSVYKPGQF